MVAACAQDRGAGGGDPGFCRSGAEPALVRGRAGADAGGAGWRLGECAALAGADEPAGRGAGPGRARRAAGGGAYVDRCRCRATTGCRSATRATGRSASRGWRRRPGGRSAETFRRMAGGGRGREFRHGLDDRRAGDGGGRGVHRRVAGAWRGDGDPGCGSAAGGDRARLCRGGDQGGGTVARDRGAALGGPCGHRSRSAGDRAGAGRDAGDLRARFRRGGGSAAGPAGGIAQPRLAAGAAGPVGGVGGAGR